MVLGDASVCYNPFYGQGMTVAAKSVELLHTMIAARLKRGDGLEQHQKSLLGIAKVLGTAREWGKRIVDVF